MKVTEIKKSLKALKRPDLEKLIIELYKNIPEKVIEAKGIDLLFLTPKMKIIDNSKLVEKYNNKVSVFCENFKAGHYGYPNQIISKPRRKKWRFEVMAFYKEIDDLILHSTDKSKLIKSFDLLFDALCFSCEERVVSSQNVFSAIKRSQSEFLQKLIQLYRLIYSDEELFLPFLEKVFDCSTAFDTSRDDLYKVVINSFAAPMTISALIETANLLLQDKLNEYKPHLGSIFVYTSSLEDKIQDLVEAISIMYFAVFENKNAIEIFAKTQAQKTVYRDEEIMVYILIRTIEKYSNNPKPEMLDVLLDSKKRKIQLRPSLLDLLRKLQHPE